LGSAFLLISCLLLWVFISRYKPDVSASFLIDALMVAAMISMLFVDANEHARGNVARAVHVLVAPNCVIAIIEASTGWRLFPFVVEGQVQTWDYRATALFGQGIVYFETPSRQLSSCCRATPETRDDCTVAE
jgi:hypothetical protein